MLTIKVLVQIVEIEWRIVKIIVGIVVKNSIENVVPVKRKHLGILSIVLSVENRSVGIPAHGQLLVIDSHFSLHSFVGRNAHAT